MESLADESEAGEAAINWGSFCLSSLLKPSRGSRPPLSKSQVLTAAYELHQTAPLPPLLRAFLQRASGYGEVADVLPVRAFAVSAPGWTGRLATLKSVLGSHRLGEPTRLPRSCWKTHHRLPASDVLSPPPRHVTLRLFRQLCRSPVYEVYVGLSPPPKCRLVRAGTLLCSIFRAS